jgi:hypothetical protein
VKRATSFVLALGIVFCVAALSGTAFLALLGRERRASGLPPLPPAVAPAGAAGLHAGGPRTDDERLVRDSFLKAHPFLKAQADDRLVRDDVLAARPPEPDVLVPGFPGARVAKPRPVDSGMEYVEFLRWGPHDVDGLSHWKDPKGHRLIRVVTRSKHKEGPPQIADGIWTVPFGKYTPAPRMNSLGDRWLEADIRAKEDARRRGQRAP